MSTQVLRQATRPIEILLVEDNPGDIELTREAMEEGKIANRLSVAVDGEQALNFLRREGEYDDAPRPDLILLDINLPKKNGIEVLTEIKRDPDLRRIPVIMLTTSTAEQDLLAAYGAYANCYVKKPIDMDEFIEAVRSIERFWLSFVLLPPQ
jgi:chemotaxis family two-component system response regulator Rcp1